MSSKQSDPVGSWKPSKARSEFRTNPSLEGKSSSGYCMGYLQANLAILPSALADDFGRFCELNKAPCPLLYRGGIGELSAGILAPNSVVTTDLQMYCVSENGIITKKLANLESYPMDDHVSFYIGCSFSFEEAMIKAGIELQNVTKNCNVSMFITNIPCVSVGPFACPMVVSMRPIPKDLVETAVIITAAYDAVHGAPIHIGDPTVIGIEDTYKTDFGDPSDIGDLIPVFWACGVTSSLAVRSAKPPLSFSHSPGSMFICDTTVDEYFDVHKPEHGDEQPRLVILSEQPYLASVCSASTIEKIDELANLAWESHNKSEGSDNSVVVANDLLKIAVRLSHAPSVVMCFLNEEDSFSSDASASDCIQGAVALIKALQTLDKKITIVTQGSGQLFEDSITASAARGQISANGVNVVEWDKGCMYQGKINHRLDTMIALQVASNTENSEIKGCPVDRLYQEVKSMKSGIVTIKVTTSKHSGSLADASLVDSHTVTTNSLKMAGCALSMALYILSNCPIHSRYARRGIGKRRHFQVEQFILNKGSEEDACSRMFERVVEN